VFDSSLLVFVGLSLLFAVVPGPDMATVTRNCLAHGRRGVLNTVAGIALAVCFWTVAAAIGVAAVLEASARLFSLLEIAGALYLAYLGIRTLWGTRHGAVPEDHAEGLPAPASRLFRQGYLSAQLNPKLGVFFVTFLPQFVHPGQPALARMLLLGGIFGTIGVGWLIVYGLALTRLRDVIGSNRVRVWMSRCAGVVMLGFAARLALNRG
jgi:threonine/homoserine/homoserine lactone efflux protein